MPGRREKPVPTSPRETQGSQRESASLSPQSRDTLTAGLLDLLRIAAEILEADLCLVAIQKYDSEPLRVAAAYQANSPFTEADQVKVAQGLPAGWALSRRQLVYLPQARLESDFYILPGLTGAMYAPFGGHGGRAGVLCIVTRQPENSWGPPSQDLAQRLAEQVGLMVEMSRTYNDVSRFLAGDRRGQNVKHSFGETWAALNRFYTELVRQLHELELKQSASGRALQSQLLLSEKMASLGQLIAGVAHELNNPLTAVLGFSELVLANHQLPGDLRQDLSTIVAEAHRARKIVQNLLSFARASESAKTFLDINRIIDETLELREYELRTSQIHLERQLTPGLPLVLADADQIKQVLLNIVVNAEQALLERPPPRRLVISTKLAAVTMAGNPSRWVEIRCRDNGPGIAAENLTRIFDLFFTTKEVGTGTGLGLAISSNIVEEHGGQIFAENSPDGGAEFVLRFPIDSRPSFSERPRTG